MVNGLGLLFMKVTFGASSSNSRLTKVTFWLTMSNNAYTIIYL